MAITRFAVGQTLTAAQLNTVVDQVNTTTVQTTDAGWSNITPSQGSGTFRYRLWGPWIHIQAYLSGVSIASGASSTYVAIAAVPAAYRPLKGTTQYGSANFSGSLSGQIQINDAGNISFLNNTGSTVTNARGTLSYMWG